MTKAPPPDFVDFVDPSVDLQLNSVSHILSTLDDAPLDPDSPLAAFQNRIVAVRLGIASSLFQSLRVRHRPTAAHCLRVAIGCSSWSLATEMTEDERDELEVAALLHDIGKIGATDEILKQPTCLNTDQAILMDQTRRYGLQILSDCCGSKEVLRNVAYAGAWFDGSQGDYQLSGPDIPLGARMLSIVDAFDAMTTDRVYRKALPTDAAIAELFACAGTQFDPQLVDHFAQIHNSGRLTLNERVTKRWLYALSEDVSKSRWRAAIAECDLSPPPSDELFHQRLFHAIHEGAFFMDPNGIVQSWNRSAERLTGISSSSIEQQRWDPTLVKMKDNNGRIVLRRDCPILNAIFTDRKFREQIMVRGREGNFLQIDLLVVPVIARDGTRMGVAALLRDATSETFLEKRVESLHKKAMSDPLTGLANRAEFDSFHKSSIERHRHRGGTCCLIICDIDRFKLVNDEHGHQAGDAALINFASILQRSCREGDLVARYGGEEFVMVCEDCTAAAATKLAEAVRIEISETQMPELGGRSVTASFGVTELQLGDTAETMLRRADRGLMQAKDTGRNKVVQLGVGMETKVSGSQHRSNWWSWVRTAGSDEVLCECRLSTNVPLPLVAEKLRGFVADHKAEIVTISSEQVVLHVTTATFQQNRRSSDRAIPFRMQLDFTEMKAELLDFTIIHVRLSPVRHRDRRTTAKEASRMLVNSLQCYLVAQIYRGEG